MDEAASESTFPSVDAFVTDEGRGYSAANRGFSAFVSAIVAALDAATDSVQADRLRQGMLAVFRPADPKDETWGARAAWWHALRLALEERATTHLENNSDLRPRRELAEELCALFHDGWAKDYLESLDAEDATPPLWPFLEARWLEHLRGCWEARRGERPELGILFVHGIGVQQQGHTLERFGRPIVEWFGNGASVREATLRDTTEGTPAHSIVDISTHRASWLLAESWWAEQFATPSFAELTSWLLTVGPSLALAHLGKWVTQRFLRLFGMLVPPPRSWLWPLSVLTLLTVALVAIAATLLISFVMTVTLQLAALILGTVSLIPNLRSKAAVARVMGFMRSVLGDSLAFADNRLTQAAILTRVRRDLEWLAKRAQKVVVIAHSQGAAVAHRVLRKDVPPNVALLITVGSGLGKLERASARGWTTLQRSVVWVVPTMPIFFWLAPRLIEPLGNLVLYTGLFYVAAYLTALTAALKPLKTELTLEPIRWIDYYASHDPVPNGPLVPVKGGDWLESHKVHNYGSMLRDHSAYFDNRDEFVPALLRDIEHHVGSVALPGGLERLATEGSRARAARVRWLQAHRLAALLACVGGGLLGIAQLPDLGTTVAKLETSSLSTRTLEAAAGTAESLVARFPLEEGVGSTLGYGALGWLTLVALVAPFLLLGRWAWSGWNRAAMQSASEAGEPQRTQSWKSDEGPLPYPRLMRAVGYVLAIAATWLLLQLDLSGWLSRLVLFPVLMVLLPFTLSATFDSRASWPPQVPLISLAIAGMLWVALQTALSPTIGLAYLDAWHATVFLGAALLDKPLAVAPLVVMFGPPFVVWVVGSLGR